MKHIYFLLIALAFASSSISQTTVLTENFDGSFPPTNWNIIQNGAGANWGQSASNTYAGAGCAYIYASTDFEDTWMITPDIAMTAGNTYTIEYYQVAGSSCGVCDDASMKVTVGQGQTVGNQTTTLQAYGSLSNTSYVLRSHDFVAPSNGNYNFAFHCYSGDAQSPFLRVDEVTITEQAASTPCTHTTAITDLSCFDACDGSILISSSGGTAPYSVDDPNSGSPLSYSSTQLLSNLCADSYELVITDDNSCQDTVNVTVNEPTELVATASIDMQPSNATDCDGEVSVNVTGGTSPYSLVLIDCNTPADSILVGSGPYNSLCPGDYQFVVEDDNGCADTSDCQALIDQGLGLNHNETNLNLYPNPAVDQIRIYGSDIQSVQIFTMNGQSIKSFTVTTSNTLVNVDDLPSGSYLMEIQQGNRLIHKKLVIQK